MGCEMDSPIIGALLAFLGGCAVAVVNDRLNRLALKRKPDALPRMSILREILSVAYLVIVYSLREVLPWELPPLLIGAAVGLTVPSVLLSLRLAKINDELSKKEASEKGEDQDG